MNFLAFVKYFPYIGVRSAVDGLLDRSAFDYALKNKLNEILLLKKSLPSICAVYRVKNGESFIESSILSTALFCSEIVVVNNGSTDLTSMIVERLAIQLKEICEVRIIHDDRIIAVAGDDYSSDLSHKISLSQFYNDAFSHGCSDYLVKVDAHYIFTLKGVEIILRRINEKPKFLIYRGVEIFGKKLSFETFMFKNDNNFSFIDGEKYEELVFNFKIPIIEKLRNTIFSPVYIHVKRLNYIRLPNAVNLAKELYK